MVVEQSMDPVSPNGITQPILFLSDSSTLSETIRKTCLTIRSYFNFRFFNSKPLLWEETRKSIQ